MVAGTGPAGARRARTNDQLGDISLLARKVTEVINTPRSTDSSRTRNGSVEAFAKRVMATYPLVEEVPEVIYLDAPAREGWDTMAEF